MDQQAADPKLEPCSPSPPPPTSPGSASPCATSRSSPIRRWAQRIGRALRTTARETWTLRSNRRYRYPGLLAIGASILIMGAGQVLIVVAILIISQAVIDEAGN